MNHLIDGFDRHFQASVHLTLSSGDNNSNNIKKFPKKNFQTQGCWVRRKNATSMQCSPQPAISLPSSCRASGRCSPSARSSCEAGFQTWRGVWRAGAKTWPRWRWLYFSRQKFLRGLRDEPGTRFWKRLSRLDGVELKGGPSDLEFVDHTVT